MEDGVVVESVESVERKDWLGYCRESGDVVLSVVVVAPEFFIDLVSLWLQLKAGLDRTDS